MSNSSVPVPISAFPAIREELKKSFRSGKTRDIAYRKQQLAQVAYMVQENADRFNEAIRLDLHRPYLETVLTELGPVVGQALLAIENLEQWTAPNPLPEAETAPFHKGWDLKTLKLPRGVVFIIGPWNYPMILTLGPLIGAIAAGCCAVVKPSELSSHFSNLLFELVPKYLDQSCYRIVPGNVPEVTALLDLQWDMIFYTGNERVGKIVATAAAKHLTPCTLELGGKCPVIIDENITPEVLNVAARRIAWGKTQCAGQICVSPDYVVVPASKHDELVEAIKDAFKSFFPDGAAKSDSYGRIIASNHHKRISDLLANTKGKIVSGGATDAGDSTHFIEPTIVVDVSRDDVLMQDEIFAPVLPIIKVDGLDAAVEYINGLPDPLCIYLFSTDDATKQKVAESTRSGQIVYNETMGQLGVYELPFGGVGASGYGTQMGRHTFEGFCKDRGSIDVPLSIEPMFAFRYPPYTEQGLNFFRGMYQREVPVPKHVVGTESLLGDLTDKVKQVMGI
ncbi:hypothetical protein FRB99_002894 [Tulasnella sp. 403]|nr:hypothetical protein FRB99_002894 [Tulasnella sp. 403]